MIDHPILFSAPMVRAIIDGRKTQTRRTIKFPKRTASGGRIYENPLMGGWEPTTNGGDGCFTFGRGGERIPAPETIGMWHRTCGSAFDLKWQPGDTLWVRETWQTHCDLDAFLPSALPADASIAYPATYDGWVSKKRPSIHMPRWASRITLAVEAVRVERLQDIGEADACAEGWPMDENGPIVWYAALWDTINGAGSWDANPWVSVATFRRVP